MHHRPLARYVNLRVEHATGMSGTFFPPPRVSDHDIHHERDARSVMHGGIVNLRFPLESMAGKTFPAFPLHA